MIRIERVSSGSLIVSAFAFLSFAAIIYSHGALSADRKTEADAKMQALTHGWPGSIVEQLKIIGPLTDPTAHGGSAEDAFDIVIPALPGYGFSGKPTNTGLDPKRIARAWAELMKRLGYTRYVAQGGDRGAPVSSAMARQRAAGLVGIHINLPATIPAEVAAALAGGSIPAGLSDKERAVLDALMANAKKGNSAYFVMMTTRPYWENGARGSVIVATAQKTE